MITRAVDQSGNPIKIDSGKCLKYGVHFGYLITGFGVVKGSGIDSSDGKEKLWVRDPELKKIGGFPVMIPTDLVPLSK